MTYFQHIYFFCCLLAVDLITIRILRKLLRDFLRSKKNKHALEQLHFSRSRKERISLSYIYPLLKRNQTAFSWYYKLYLAVLYTILPQYLIIGLLYGSLGNSTIYAIFIFGGIKIVIYFLVRGNFDANMVSIYRK